MPDAPLEQSGVVAPINGALQHGPRPLPSFLAMLRRESAGDPAMIGTVLSGVRAYQRAPRSETVVPAPVIARAGRASIRDYGGTGPSVLFVPSLINPPTILDLDADRSLLRWLAGQGVRALMVDWGHPRGDERLDVGGHVTDLLLPLIATLPDPPVLAGYCLGGTMAIAAASLTPVRGLVLIAAPWHFAAYPHEARAGLVRLWQEAGPVSRALGLLPMEALQLAFWQVDPARTLAKFADLARLHDDPARLRSFVALEDWANDGPPLTVDAARELLESFFGADATGRGLWSLRGRTIDPALLECPVLQFISTSDRLVPAASCPATGDRRLTSAGHVGMVVGRSGPAGLWQPLRDWVRALEG